jgi:MFS family permease
VNDATGAGSGSPAGSVTHAADPPRPATALLALCVTEITSWGVLYYAFPVLAPRIRGDTGWSAPATAAAFSVALVIAAVAGIPVGRVLDRRGPRAVMATGSALASVAVVGVAVAPTLVWFAAAWCVAGVGLWAVE